MWVCVVLNTNTNAYNWLNFFIAYVYKLLRSCLRNSGSGPPLPITVNVMILNIHASVITKSS